MSAPPFPISNEPAPPLTLTAAEWEFFVAAVDTLIPADELTPSASECGVVTFIDRQLAGPWGEGAKLYRDGPHRAGKPEQGYQLAFTPREFFAAGIAATDQWARHTYGADFEKLDASKREHALRALEAGEAVLADFNGRQFFEALLQITMEGFFSDPIYGGNRDKVGWRLVGYPGLPAKYADLIEQYRNRRYSVEPRSIADVS